MSEEKGRYKIGGWCQNPADKPPASFSYTMYGMITNLRGLTSGTRASPGWSPAHTRAPEVPGKVLWTYGGGGASPVGMPDSDIQVEAIIQATGEKGWDGIDFDDESEMNLEKIIRIMGSSTIEESGYTFLAGHDYNNPRGSERGRVTNTKVREIARAGVARRFNLMCYAAKMWSMSDIEANVGPAIERTLENGVSSRQVVLALTPAGLTEENLTYFLNQVLSREIGGLFIWNFPALKSTDLEMIVKTLEPGE